MYTTVKYELHEIEKIVPLQVNGINSGPEWEDQFNGEIERIKKALVNEVFTFEDERHLERYIQYHQQAVIRLLDNEIFLLATTSADRSAVTLAAWGLEELLTFIERHFTKYFDQDAKAPAGYLASMRKAIKINLKKIFRDLSERNADERLIEILLQALTKVTDRTMSTGHTYRKLMYAKEVQKELLKLIEHTTAADQINGELVKLIYYLNYNSTKAFTYHAQKINHILDAAESRTEKLEQLSLYLKQINQAQVRPGIAYNPRAGSIRDQLSGYIAEEMEYLERIQLLSDTPANPKLETITNSFKIKVELSVSQFSYLIKVFIATALIQTTNTQGLLRFLSKIIITKKSESISYDSLRAKFYNVETGTRSAVRELLALMIIHVDRDR